MKLSTNKLFTSSKYPQNKKTTVKPKKSSCLLSTYYKIHGRQISDNLKYPDKKTINVKIDKQQISKKNHTASPKVNPFNEGFVNASKNEKKYHKKMSSKVQNFNLEFLKTKQNIWNKPIDIVDNTNDIDINNIILTSESDSNKQIQSDYDDIEILCDLFKKNSKLKSNIIIDNYGNNNLNSEQEKFITDCFNKKEKLEKNINKCKINTVKVQNYNHNDILLKQNKDLKTEKNTNDILNRRLKRFSICDCKRRKFYSSKNNIINNFFGFNLKKEKNENNTNKEEKDKNSMFENNSNKSLDSSFLGSSIAEDYIQMLGETERVRSKIIF